MNSREKLISCQLPFPSLPGLDEPLTDQELAAIDAIEATLQSQCTSSSTSQSSSTTTATTTAAAATPYSVIKKRYSNVQNDTDPQKTRRQLPSSILGLSKPFSLSPCQVNVRMKYPAMKFGGCTLYSRTQMEVEKAARSLLQNLHTKKGETGQVAIGFDIEWKPTFRRGVLPGKAAVMQICGDASHCHVMHIIHSGITQSLQFLLEDSTLLKVGVGIQNDCVKVFKDYNVQVNAVEDLSYLANQKLGGEPKSWGLKSLAEMLVCKELHKPKKIRLGNWEVDVLSKDQLQYAATDAFTSWHLYQVLKSLPDTKDTYDKRTKELKILPQ